MKRVIVYIITIISVSALSLFAQTDLNGVGENGVNIKRTGQTSFNFLQIGVSPRASAMGNANTALSKGVESIFSNPAGLPEMNTNFEFFCFVNSMDCGYKISCRCCCMECRQLRFFWRKLYCRRLR